MGTGVRNPYQLGSGVLLAGDYVLLNDGGRLMLRALASPDGPITEVAAPGIAGADNLLAFDGSTIAYSGIDCRNHAETTVMTLQDALAPLPAGAAAGCPVTVDSHIITVDRRRRATITITCPNGCSGQMSLPVSDRAVTKHEANQLLSDVLEQTLTLGPDFNFGPGAHTIKLRFGAAARGVISHYRRGVRADV